MFPVYSRYAFIPTRRSGPVYTKFVPIYIPTDCIPMICSSIYQFPSIFAVFLFYSSYIPVCCCGYSLCSHILSIFQTFPITMSILTYYSIICSVYSQYSQLWKLHCIFPISTFPLYFHFHISSRTSMGISGPKYIEVLYHIKPIMGAYPVSLPLHGPVICGSDSNLGTSNGWGNLPTIILHRQHTHFWTHTTLI